MIHYKGNQYLAKGSKGYELYQLKKFAELDKHLKTIQWL